MRSVVVILVKHMLPRIATVQNVVANPSDGSSYGLWHSAMLPQKAVGKPANNNKKEECPRLRAQQALDQLFEIRSAGLAESLGDHEGFTMLFLLI